MRNLRAFTLVELLVAMMVSAVALVAAITAANAQQRAYHNGQKLRDAQSNARAALLALEGLLPRAGYGMDAPLAIDFQWYDAAANGTCPAQLDPCAPDRVDESDEITIYARNPAYWVPRPYGEAVNAEPSGKAWKPTALSGDTLTVRGHLGDRFRKGQILQVVCSGLMKYGYVTVGATGPADVAAEGDETLISLMPALADDPFRQQGAVSALECFEPTGGTFKEEAKLFLIDRFRFHVRPVDTGDGRLDPFLVIDNGVDNDGSGVVDAEDEQLVAEGIESIQLGYLFAEPTIPEAGVSRGTSVTISPGTTAVLGTKAETIVATRFLDPNPLAPGVSVYEYSSFLKYSTVRIPPARKTNAQANLRGLTIAIVARSPEPDPSATSNLRYVAGSPLYRLNQNAAPAWIASRADAQGNDGYQRAVVESSVLLRNMLTRTVSYY